MTVNFTEVVTQMGVMLLIVAAGYAMRRFHWTDKSADGAFSQIIVRMTAPALVFYGVVGNREQLLSGNLPQVVLAVGVTVLIAGLLAGLVFRGKKLHAEHRTVLRITTMFGNVSFLGIPLCYGLFGQEGLMYASLYAAAQDLLFWSLGVAMMGHGTAKLDWKRMINPSLVGILLAAFLVLTGIPVPEFLMKTASTVGAATLPLSLLVVGAGFHGVHLGRDTLRALLPVAGLKLVVVPAIMAVVLSLIPMAPVARAVLAMEIAMPSAAATVALARTNGQDWQYAAGAVMLTTLLSAVTVPLMVLLLNAVGG